MTLGRLRITKDMLRTTSYGGRLHENHHVDLKLCGLRTIKVL